MASYAKDEQVTVVWEIGTTGLLGNITATLYRYADESSRAVASESVTIAEIGTTGAYSAIFSPENAHDYQLKLVESSLYLEEYWMFKVEDTPPSVTEDYCYCTEADVTAITGIDDYDGSSTPTQAEVIGFMEKIAAEIYGAMSEHMGSDTPGPVGYDTIIDTSVDIGRALSRVTKLANMLGAGMHAVEASGASERPARTERAEELLTLYQETLKSVVKTSLTYHRVVSNRRISATHYDEGRVTRGSFTPKTESGFQVDNDTKF